MTKTAFLFPGQGAQTVGMASELVERLPVVRDLFEMAKGILGYDLAEMCFSGPAEKLNSTVFSQPALFVCGLAALESLRATSPDVVERCQASAGLSLGEYTAMVFAGGLDMETGLRVVQRRGEAMQRAADTRPSGMVSVLGLEPAALADLCDQQRNEGEVLQIANFLCPGNTVVSGDTEACQRLAEEAVAAGAMKVIPLAVAGAFHTSIMDSALDELREALDDAEIRTPRIPVISNVDAQPHDDPDELRSLLIQQVVCPVLWEDSMRGLLAQEYDDFYELGPGRVLTGLMKRIHRKTACQKVPC
ncbi:MAG TPA: ACP S-malonyltransferase [Planctomycetaceae bacterium]|nr:ACP S-malonyltransferase [Planctomycetaceae bacterium]